MSCTSTRPARNHRSGARTSRWSAPAGAVIVEPSRETLRAPAVASAAVRNSKASAIPAGLTNTWPGTPKSPGSTVVARHIGSPPPRSAATTSLRLVPRARRGGFGAGTLAGATARVTAAAGEGPRRADRDLQRQRPSAHARQRQPRPHADGGASDDRVGPRRDDVRRRDRRRVDDLPGAIAHRRIRTRLIGP